MHRSHSVTSIDTLKRFLFSYLVAGEPLPKETLPAVDKDRKVCVRVSVCVLALRDKEMKDRKIMRKARMEKRGHRNISLCAHRLSLNDYNNLLRQEILTVEEKKNIHQSFHTVSEQVST